jgi:hypothetical protein
MKTYARAVYVALAVAFAALLSVPAHADSGSIHLNVVKGGWFVGGSGGNGTLVFRGRRYALSVGGLDAGFVFGASRAHLSGRVRNIRRASDVAGVYAAAGAGAVIGTGVRAIVLRNEKGAILELSGRQVGLMLNADLSGLAISLR